MLSDARAVFFPKIWVCVERMLLLQVDGLFPRRALPGLVTLSRAHGVMLGIIVCCTLYSWFANVGTCVLDLTIDPSDSKDSSWSSSQSHYHCGLPKPGSSQTSSPSTPQQP